MLWHVLSTLIVVSFQSISFCLYYLAYGCENPPSSSTGKDSLVQNVLDLCVSNITFYTLNESVQSLTGQVNCDGSDSPLASL